MKPSTSPPHGNFYLILKLQLQRPSRYFQKISCVLFEEWQSWRLYGKNQLVTTGRAQAPDG